ncbi:MAG: hypothetical protein NC034_04865 [Ruminococcus sp.]|nr:hypothetical protein [Ruminococcus sp.]
MKKLKKTKGKGIFGIITKVTALAAVISCVVSIIVTNSSHAEMKKELDALNIKTEELEAENAELERILADNDMDAYMEKIAIEKMNYAYPDERRFYDTSRN